MTKVDEARLMNHIVETVEMICFAHYDLCFECPFSSRVEGGDKLCIHIRDAYQLAKFAAQKEVRERQA